MANVLISKEVAGSTRFYLDIQLTKSMKEQLLNDFKKDYPHIIEPGISLKFLNQNKTSGIEIGKDFISFFPPLNNSDLENMQERIYKHISKKSDIYLKTSKDNIDGTITSILGDDLRSSASLLYYALHKFINSEMYSYLNDVLHLEDFEIDLNEIEHFTSNNFRKAKEHELPNEKISKENYQLYFCTNKKSDRVNPFQLIKQIILKDKEYDFFIDYMNIISSKLFDVEFKKGSDMVYKEYLEAFYNDQKNRVRSSAEREVNAAIACCFLDILKSQEGNNAQSMIYILSLRLYWLRQTADYEFDFEVKTSLRELSITLKTVMDFIELQLFSRSEEENFFEKNDEGKSVTNVENIDINNNPVKEFDYISYYYVKVNFPLNDFLIEKPILYISAVHLNTSFTKEYIFSVLNFMDGITNKGKYFKYHTYNDFSLPLNLHIDDEGRWTVWFSIKEINGLGYILYNDLITKFEDFINNFNNRIYELKNILYIKLISSNPLLEDGDLNSFSINGMSGLKNGLLDRKNLLEYLITDQVSKELTLKKNNPNTLELNSKWNIRLNISIDDFEELGNLPLRYMLVQELSKNEKKTVYINLVITNKFSEKIDREEDDIIFENEIISDFFIDHGIFINQLKYSGTVVYTPDELESYNNDKFMGKFYLTLNDIIYTMIERGYYNDGKILLDKCLSSPNVSFVHYATMGYWYFRNNTIELEIAENKGKEFYERAIKLESGKYYNQLKQKYYYEMGRFNLKRKNDYMTTKAYLNSALRVDSSVYSEDINDLMSELEFKISIKETAAFKDVNDNNKGDDGTNPDEK